MTSFLLDCSDDDSNMEEVALDIDKPTENAGESLQRHASQLGAMLWRLSTQTSKVTRYLMMTVVLTQTLVGNLDAEKAEKWEPGKGNMRKTRRSLLARIIDSLEDEAVENDDDRESVTSASSENSDFVGGHRRVANAGSTCHSSLPSSIFLCDSDDWEDDLYQDVST
jgi:hypothetical protein